jgi:hypothetical protein
MNKKIAVICLVLCVSIVNFSMASANVSLKNAETEITDQFIKYDFSDDYGIQWEMNFGSDRDYGARLEGPQPIGDCDNDGDNEILVGGRDGRIRVFEWDETKQTYLEMHTLHCPFYPFESSDPGGFAIGDLTGNGKNEIGASWSTAIHKWNNGKYKIIGFNNWIFENGGGSADCYVGDYDTDGENELIMSGGPMHDWSTVPEIMVYKWNGASVVKEAEWDNPDTYGFVYMAGLGDVDEDGENEIVCGSGLKVFVLDWDKDKKEFDETIIKTTGGYDYPFACVCKDSDGDGKDEIHIGFWSPKFTIMEWNGNGYETKFEKEWPDEGQLIEGVDVGDVDDDGIAEVCVGTDVVHVLQWNGSTYVEEAVLPTYGDLSVVSIGDCDNDGINEINAGSVMIDHGQDYMFWVYKYGYNTQKNGETKTEYGSLKVTVKRAIFGTLLNDASVAAWNLETGTWYVIQDVSGVKGSYKRIDLPEGEYLLRVQMERYKKQEVTITINAGQKTTHTFILKSTSLSRTASVQRPISNLLIQILEKIIDNFSLLIRIR